MNRIFIVLAGCLIGFPAMAQSLVLKGRVRCINQHVSSTRGAENIIIVPTFIPSRSTITGSAPPGYFEINTGIPYPDLQDKQVHLFIISKCMQCRQIAKRVFISEDQDKKSSDPQKVYVTVRDWKLDANCTEAELNAFRADSMLAVVMKQPSVNVKELSSATAAVGTPPLLNLLSSLASVPTVVANGILRADSLRPGKVNYGNFLFSSPISLSSNTGFNFSPSRNISEAMFWNPSTIVYSQQPHSISLFTNARNNLKLGGFVGLNSNISLGAGVVYAKQSEAREIEYRNISSGNVLTEQHIIKLDEYAVFLSPAFKINNSLSIALTGKLIAQNFNAPGLLNNTNPDNPPVFIDSAVKRKNYEVDLSFTYKVTPALQVGVNLMNLAGSELHADAFAVSRNNIKYISLRSAGLGLTYKWKRFNIGTDLLFTEAGFYDAAVGVNYVPFNYALISAGIALKQLSYSAAFQIKNFRITYVQDNEAMFYERRKENISFFNGKLYTGFTFKF